MNLSLYRVIRSDAKASADRFPSAVLEHVIDNEDYIT